MFDWPYFTLVNGKLYYDVGSRNRAELVEAFQGRKIPLFADVAQAEAWLEANDERGNVRPQR